MEAKKKPIRVIRCRGLEAAVWRDTRNKDGREIDVYSIKISKSYKDKNTGEWKNTDFLYLEDLPRLATLANETYALTKIGTPASMKTPTPTTTKTSTSLFESRPTRV